MNTKFKRWRIVLVIALSIIVSMIVYQVYQDEKAREAKRIDMIGAVEPETLVASKKAGHKTPSRSDLHRVFEARKK